MTKKKEAVETHFFLWICHFESSLISAIKRPPELWVENFYTFWNYKDTDSDNDDDAIVAAAVSAVTYDRVLQDQKSR